MKSLHVFPFVLMLLVTSCSASKKTGKGGWNEFSWEGHRGARGLVNNAADMKRLIDPGVDGIISDYPDLFAQVKK